MKNLLNKGMSNKCVNYKFCNGVAYPELDEELCLLCGLWYDESEGWGKLEFIESKEDCAVCYSHSKVHMKFPTNCGHSFCIQCCKNLLYFQDDIYDICPIKYGCPPCLHYVKDSIKSCVKRPCCDEDEIILDKWEIDNYESFIKWNYDEFNYINEDKDYLVTKKCPMCRKIYEKIK